jgi:hypothetical protein
MERTSDDQAAGPAGLSARVETWTGTISGASAGLQIVLVPAALALAATLVGAVNVLVR